MEVLKKLNKLAALPFLAVLWVYQRTVSPDHGFFKAYHPHGFCKFYPSCSEYARLNLKNTGISTLPKIIVRILKCNPFAQASVDLP